MLNTAYHATKPLVNQEITPPNRLSLVPLYWLGTTIVIAIALHLLGGSL